jgi:hypothetical protein
VHDEGPGIPASDQTRIFEPFRRRTSDPRVPGVGLGLSLVRAVAEAHDGSIRVESETGRGTTFTLVLPRSMPHPLPPHTALLDEVAGAAPTPGDPAAAAPAATGPASGPAERVTHPKQAPGLARAT